MSVDNSRNIPYLCTKYMSILMPDEVVRGFQKYPNAYRFPADMVQQNAMNPMRYELKNELLKMYDVYILHERFNTLEGISNMANDVEGVIIPYLYTVDELEKCITENRDLLDNAPIILIRQPNLKYGLEDWKERVVYVPSPCSIDTVDNVVSKEPNSEYVFPDDWVIFCSFGKKISYPLGVVNKVSNIRGDSKVLLFKVVNLTRPELLSAIHRFDIHLHLSGSDFYSQSCIETAMAGVPTLTRIASPLMDYVKDSPFIVVDRDKIVDQVMDVIDNLEDYKMNCIGHPFLEQHKAPIAVGNILDELKKRKVI